MNRYDRWEIPPKILVWPFPEHWPQWAKEKVARYYAEREAYNNMVAARIFMEGSFTSTTAEETSDE